MRAKSPIITKKSSLYRLIVKLNTRKLDKLIWTSEMIDVVKAFIIITSYCCRKIVVL